MINTNKGNSVIIVSIIIGLLVLSLGGYFGYNWYQNNLKKEKISRLEKINSSIEDLVKSYETPGTSGSNFDGNDFIEFKRYIEKFKDNISDLEELKEEDDVKKEVKNCIEDSKGIVKNINVVINLGEKRLSGKTITNIDAEEAKGALRNIDEYNNLKSCKEAQSTIKSLIRDLKK